MGKVVYTVIVRPRARKQLKKIPRQYRTKITSALRYLAHDPFSGKRLTGEHKGEYALRVWPYRIIYIIEKKRVTVFVLAIGHRQAVYK